MAFSFPFFKKKPENHVYFGLYFTEKRITGFAFDLDESKANILSQNGYDVTEGYEKMLEDTDTLISDLESKIHIPLDKTIFFLHSTLLDSQTHEIIEPYKETLKKISKELELEPMGYIDTHEAIEGDLKEKSIINTILIELGHRKLTVFVYKGGIMTASQSISRTDSVVQDLEASLKALPEKTILPSKIMLYGVGDMTAASSEIASYSWDPKTFIQHPTIEVISDISLYQILADTFVEELLIQDSGVSAEPNKDVSANPVETPTVSTLPFGFSSVEGASFKNKVVEKIPEKPQVSSVSPVTENKQAAWKFNRNNVTRGLIIASVLIFFALSFLGYEYFVHAATVEITLPAEELASEVNLTLPLSDTVSDDALAVIQHVKVVEYDDEKKATGKREVGEKAKGDVILHNFDNAEKSIDRGTELKAGNLLFTLDSDVKIASASGISADGIKQSGKQKAPVTAKEIGEDFNISKGTQLKVGSLSDSLFIAIADAAFTGGVKKQVTTVSKSDLDSLKKEVEEEMKKQAEMEIAQLKEDTDEIITELTTVEVTNTDYSGEVGEEAKNLAIKASSEISYYTIDKKGLKKELSGALSKEKKEDYTIAENAISYEIDEATIVDGEEVELLLNTTANQYKKVDLERIRDVVAFKQTSKVESEVRSLVKVDKVTIKPAGKTLPFTTAWLPFFKKNITIKTAN